MERLIEKQLVLWKYKTDRKPLIVFGARQVGKSYSLLEFGKRHYSNVAYFFFENNRRLQTLFEAGIDNVANLFLQLEAISGQTIRPQVTLVIFDEIQACPAAIAALKRICEEANDYHVAAAGSLLGLVLGREAGGSFPVGKVDSLYMYPMNFREFLWAMGRSALAQMIENCFADNLPMSQAAHEAALELHRIYLAVGGMPEVVSEYITRGDFNYVRAKQLAICESYTNDMIKYSTRTEAMRTIAAYNSIPAQLGRENKKFQYQLIQSGARSKVFADSLFWLQKSNIVIRVGKTNQGKLPLSAYEDLLSFKIYFLDVGLFAAKSDLPTNSILCQNFGAEIRGALTENYVAAELVAGGICPFYWESGGQAELDFVVQLDGKVVPIEAKSGVNTKAKSLDVFRKKYGIDHAIRISQRNFGCENNIKSVPLYAVWCIKRTLD